MNNHWLSLIRDHTDAAVIPADRGITKDAVPPGEWRRLLAAGYVEMVKGRLIITKAGRLKMDEDEDQNEELRAERRPEAEAWRQQERDEEFDRRNQ